MSSHVARSLFAFALTSLFALGCSPVEEGASEDVAALTAPASSAWYLGTFEGTCTFSTGSSTERVLSSFIADGKLVVRWVPEVGPGGEVIAMDTTMFQEPLASDGTIYRLTLDPEYPRYRQEAKGSCDAARCEVVVEGKVGDERVESGKITLTRTTTGVVLSITTSSNEFSYETGLVEGSKPWIETETCTANRTK